MIVLNKIVAQVSQIKLEVIMKKKILCILCTAILAFTGCGGNNNDSKINDSKIDFNAPYKYGLSYTEYTRYLSNFGFISDDDAFNMSWKMQDNLKEITITSDTEYIVRNINQVFFFEEPKDEEINKLLNTVIKKFGFSKENQITAEWVRDNPYDAYHLLYSCSDAWIIVMCSVPLDKSCFDAF